MCQKTATTGKLLALIAGGFAWGFSAPASAQEEPAPIPPIEVTSETPSDPNTVERDVAESFMNTPYENYLSFSYENDLIGDGKDQYYTSGVRMTYFNPNTEMPEFVKELADSIPTFDINETTSTFYTLGQNIYTPSDITAANGLPGERPYAAWLYGSMGLATLTADHVDELELTLGIVGPEALGEQTQKFIHSHITGSQNPKGWRNQLDTEPGVILSWQRRWPRGFNGDWHFDVGDFRATAEPNVNVSLGNIYTYAGTGMMFTFGPYQETLQDTPPRVKPAMSGTGYFDVPDQEWGWYLFAGLDGRAVARNIFLDGNSFDSDGPDVDKNILVGDAVAGVAFTLYDYRLSYTANYRTKEFDGQPEDTFFGSLTLTTRF